VKEANVMNQQEANKIPAGRELDVLVGEYVFGWKSISPDVPKFSTDVSAAWEVVNKFSPLHLFILERDPNDLEWNCSFNAKHGIGFADTAPLAICRAALLVFEPDNIGGV
jgi:hypothetical protein